MRPSTRLAATSIALRSHDEISDSRESSELNEWFKEMDEHNRWIKRMEMQFVIVRESLNKSS